MSPEKKIKLQAKAALGNNNWAMAVSAVLVVLAVVMAVLYLLSGLDLLAYELIEPLYEMADFSQILGEEATAESMVTSTFLLPIMVLIVPLVMGLVRFFYILSKNQTAEFSELFYYIGKRYFRSLGVFFGVLLRCLWQALVCFMPFYIGFVAISQETADKDKLAFSDNIWYFIVYALLFGGILLFAKLCIRYFLCFFLHFEDESLSIGELCTLSCTYMQKLKGSVMKLILSLFPWILSCILIFPCLFVVPYVLTSLSTSAKWIIALYHQSENKDE